MNDDILKILLLDRTTDRNIIWATAERPTQEIQLDDVYSIVPRHEKNRAHQKLRTKTRAEIFTPPTVCKIQNDLIAETFGDWKNFVRAKFLEITCGEAPYITTRYNAATGTAIPFAQRVGLLDRKLRVIDKEIFAPANRTAATLTALKSVYGYEFQGDNLFLARRNIFDTVTEFLAEKISVGTLREILPHVADIISWNFWQMDGLSKSYSPPFMEEKNFFGGANCLVKDWDAGNAVEFRTLMTKEARR